MIAARQDSGAIDEPNGWSFSERLFFCIFDLGVSVAFRVLLKSLAGKGLYRLEAAILLACKRLSKTPPNGPRKSVQKQLSRVDSSSCGSAHL